ncbi:MAG: ABC transporter substrate-binding protein [Chloroflexi bacterium]|nr:ABC transporter substrate-binding protein [Chloroflexota bacterium]
MTRTRREAIRLGLAGVAGTLLAACSVAAPAAIPTGAPPTTAPASAPSNAQPKSGGTLRVGLLGEPTNFDPHFISPGALLPTHLPYDHLTAYDDQRKPQPRLAESWDIDTDFKQFKLTLRKGVQFHSGRELTSGDVKYNLLRVRDPKVGVSQLRTLSSWFQTVDTPDRYTVVLTADQPRPAAFDLFEYLNIVDQETMEGSAEDRKKLVGTGPFVFSDYQPGDHLSFTRNASYWQSGKPFVDSIRVQIFTDQQAMVVQLEAAALDIASNPQLRDAARLKQDSQYTLAIHPTSGQYYLLDTNTSTPPTDNQKFRQALNYAIDRQRIAQSVLLGLFEARALPWPSNSPAFDAAKNQFPFDLDKARSLLAASGAPSAAFDLIYQSTSAEQAGVAQIVQSDLSSIGLNVNLKPVEPAVYVDMTGGAADQALKYTYGVGQSQYANLEPTSLFQVSYYWNPQRNAEAFTASEYGQLVQQAANEINADTRKTLYGQLNDYLLDQSFVTIFASAPPMVAARANVQGLHFSAHETLVGEDIWLA